MSKSVTKTDSFKEYLLRLNWFSGDGNFKDAYFIYIIYIKIYFTCSQISSLVKVWKKDGSIQGPWRYEQITQLFIYDYPWSQPLVHLVNSA